MEPIEAQMTYRINTSVAGIKRVDDRWFVLFEGSWEWIGLDNDEPDLKVGDRITILIQKRA